MSRYVQWLDELNAELLNRGICAVEDLDILATFYDVAATLAHWFDIDHFSPRQAAALVEAATTSSPHSKHVYSEDQLFSA